MSFARARRELMGLAKLERQEAEAGPEPERSSIGPGARQNEHAEKVLGATRDYLRARGKRTKGHADEPDKNLPLFNPNEPDIKEL